MTLIKSKKSVSWAGIFYNSCWTELCEFKWLN